MNRRLCGLLVALLLTSLCGLAEEPSYFAIRNARIVPVSGPAIENGTVVIHNGLITAVGASVPIPAAALVLDGKGLTVYPGLVDALTTLGLPEASGTAAGRPAFATAGPPSPAPSGETQRPLKALKTGPQLRPGSMPPTLSTRPTAASRLRATPASPARWWRRSAASSPASQR